MLEKRKTEGDEDMEHLTYGTLVEKHRQTILDAERQIWRHPETGFREWKTEAYLAEIFEKAGYELHKAGNIPGFYTDLDTGRPGPKLLIMGEMDALLQPNHPEAVDGKAHTCGHNCQCAALVGTALALKEPGALDGLCGSIRLMAVPAEELVETDFREDLQKQGIIRYMSGKQEFLYRGYMDGCDICYLLHASASWEKVFECWDCNGGITKDITFTGVAAHAAACPHLGINALYAANLGIQAINNLRETFRDQDHVRVNPILASGGDAIGAIPAKVTINSSIRAATIEAMMETSEKINRAMAGAALTVGAEVHIEDHPGYAPLYNDPNLVKLAGEVGRELMDDSQIDMHHPWGSACTDMGDMSCVMRTIHPHIAGCVGLGHSDDFYVKDPEMACVLGAKIQVLLAVHLLENNAAKAKEVLAGPPLPYASKEAYFAVLDQFNGSKDLVSYGDHRAEVNY